MAARGQRVHDPGADRARLPGHHPRSFEAPEPVSEHAGADAGKPVQQRAVAARLLDRLPGISTSVLADRLRRLERAGVVAREPGPVGAGVTYVLTPRGRELDEALGALRRWGVAFLADPAADGSAQQSFDVTYVDGIQALADGQFQLVVDDRTTTLHFTTGRLRQEPGAAPGAELIVRTSSAFLDRWAAGEASWDDGRARGEVITEGPPAAWPRWLAATGYLPGVEPKTTWETS